MEVGGMGDPSELNVNSQFSTIEEAESAVLSFCSRHCHPVKRESAQSAESYNKRLANPLPSNIKIFTIRWACRYYGCRKSRSRKLRSSLKIRRLLTPRGCRFHITVRFDRVVGKYRITSCHLSHNHAIAAAKPGPMKGEGCIGSRPTRASSSNTMARHVTNGQDASQSITNGPRAICTDNPPKMSISDGWNMESTQTLCDIMFELQDEGGETPALMEPLFWVKASLKMADRGYFFSSAFLRERWKQLTDRYKRARCQRSAGMSNNADEETSSTSTWELFPALDAFHHVAKRRRRTAARSDSGSPSLRASPFSSPPQQQQMLPFVTCSLLDDSAAANSSHSSASVQSPTEPSTWNLHRSSSTLAMVALGTHQVDDAAASEEPVDSKEWFTAASRVADSNHHHYCRDPAESSSGRSADPQRDENADHAVPEQFTSPPPWFARSMAEMEERLDRRLCQALEKHTNIVQEMHGTLKELLMRCVYNIKSRPS